MRTRARALGVAVLLTWIGVSLPASVDQRGAPPVATIPFELATRHIIVSARINQSRPLSFVLDTGASAAIVRMDTATELGLALEGSLSAGGAGPARQEGRFVRDATWRLVGLESLSQPVRMALPLPELPAAIGRDIDGIIGGEVIGRFVVEIDYQARRLTLHDRAAFRYQGSGQTLPLELDDNNHPVLTAVVTMPGGQLLERRFVLDIGSGGAMVFHSPFVREHDLLGSQKATVPAIGMSGAGGRTHGRIGRIESLQLGRFTIANPIAMFSEDKAGAFASAALAGNIGAQIASRFRMFLDYGRRQITLEPAATFADPFDRAFSGMAIRAYGADYRTFRVHEVMPSSPATEAGIEVGDIIVSVNGTAATELTLSMLNERLEKPATYELRLRRGEQTITITLVPRRMI
jgi:hypothetical protein